MRIVVHDYAGHAFPISLSRALAARGHDVVHAYASSLQTPRGDLARKSGDSPTLAFREIQMDPNYPRYKYSFRRRRNMEVRYGKEVAKFITSWKPDAVLSGNTPTETQEPITRAAIADGGRFYYWVQDFYSLAVDQILRRKIPVAGGWVGSWYRRLDRRQFQRSSKIIAITEDFTPILSSEFGVDPANVAVVPNWALIEEIPVMPKDNAWSRRHALHDKFVYLYSGTIGMKHNPAMLLELARRHSQNPEVRVVIVSEGIGADWLKKEAAAANLSNLLILPYQPFQELPAVLATGDVLVGILEEEAGIFSVPSKTLSYLCAARPLLLAMPLKNLAARITGENKAGLIVAPGDLEGFLDAAAKLHDSEPLRSELAGNARAYAEATFPIAKTAALFDKILAR
ncbi:MAG: glycosyltransferase family 4 protein [Luteolibacter sp.]|uniref:glycosyltransferase family 4 protein n=1 Tax=Luteolibacter sp. TaxID=1962973 RepID=UPI00326304E9